MGWILAGVGVWYLFMRPRPGVSAEGAATQTSTQPTVASELERGAELEGDREMVPLAEELVG